MKQMKTLTIGTITYEVVDQKAREMAYEYVDAAIDRDVMIADVIAALGTPVFGTVDEDNNIVLTGDLAAAVYTVGYENKDGTLVTIGKIVNMSGEPVALTWNRGYKLDSSTGAASVDSANTYAYSDGTPFEDGTELRISCTDSEGFHCHWYYYDDNDNFVGKIDWMAASYNGVTTPVAETVIPQMAGATKVKLRCNIVVADDEWSDLARLSVVRKIV